MTPAGSRLLTRDLRLAYGDRIVVDGFGVDVPDARVTVIVGANASGKSSALRGLARLLRPAGGEVLLDGTDIHRLPTKAVARAIGLLPQTPLAPDGITVATLVARGRAPHQGWLRQWSIDDERAVESAMAATRTLELADRCVDELSGGQRQRVWLAMALAQETPLLLLDEPTTYLDLAHQVEVLDLVAGLTAQRGTTVVMVLHDLNQACRYGDHMVAMVNGAVVASGAPGALVDAAFVREVFGLECVVIDDPVTGSPLVVPAGTSDRRVPT